MDYGIQLYSLRDITEKDLRGALKAVADIGYRKVEFAGYFGHSAEEIRSWMDAYGLTCCSSHDGYTGIAEHFAETVAFHKTLGNPNIIVPGFRCTTEADLNAFIDFANEYQPKLAAEGIRLGYHNHSHEFLPTEFGKYIHAEIERRTKVEFEIDTFWAFNAGVDPVATLDRLGDRIRVIHVKDGMKGGLHGGEGKPLGQGEAPVAAVYAKAVERGFGMIVESETLKPDGITEARICFEYLKSLEK